MGLIVSKEKFYKMIGKLNVKISIGADYPYTSIFRLNGKMVGKTVDREEGGLISTEYCLYGL